MKKFLTLLSLTTMMSLGSMSYTCAGDDLVLIPNIDLFGAEKRVRAVIEPKVDVVQDDIKVIVPPKEEPKKRPGRVRAVIPGKEQLPKEEPKVDVGQDAPKEEVKKRPARVRAVIIKQ